MDGVGAGPPLDVCLLVRLSRSSPLRCADGPLVTFPAVLWVTYAVPWLTMWFCTRAVMEAVRCVLLVKHGCRSPK